MFNEWVIRDTMNNDPSMPNPEITEKSKPEDPPILITKVISKRKVGNGKKNKRLQEKNTSLEAECSDLKKKTKLLSKENAKLQKQIQEYSNKIDKLQMQQPPAVPRPKHNAGIVLQVETVVALWKEITSIGMPVCFCKKKNKKGKNAPSSST